MRPPLPPGGRARPRVEGSCRRLRVVRERSGPTLGHAAVGHRLRSLSEGVGRRYFACSWLGDGQCWPGRTVFVLPIQDHGEWTPHRPGQPPGCPRPGEVAMAMSRAEVEADIKETLGLV